MHQAAGVGVGEAPRRLGTQAGGLGMAEPGAAVEDVAQAAAAEVLEHEIGAVGVLAPVENPQHVRVVERRDRARLGAEALQEGGILGQGGLEDLDGDMALQGHVFSQVDVRRCAGAQGGEQSIALSQDTADGFGDLRH